jgi:hypothetical protein
MGCNNTHQVSSFHRLNTDGEIVGNTLLGGKKLCAVSRQ